MSKPKGRPRRIVEPEAAIGDRATIINLKGSTKEADWLDQVNKSTHISKAAIVRLALMEWASKNGHPPYPGPESGQ
jgi:hypothetical protein